MPNIFYYLKFSSKLIMDDPDFIGNQMIRRLKEDIRREM